MRPAKTLFLAACAALALSACSTDGKMEGERLTVDELLPADKDAEQGQGVETVQAEPLKGQGPAIDYDAAVKDLSNEHVQMYSLDGAPTPAAPQQTMKSAPRNPSVEVFPLDQAMANTLNAVKNAAPLTPMPSESRGVAAHSQGNTVYFAHGSAELDAAGHEVVDNAAAQSGGATLSVKGYASPVAAVTDPVKRKMINLKLSMDRAFAVARALVSRGVPVDHVQATGMGETGVGDDASSRRVEISKVSGQ